MDESLKSLGDAGAVALAWRPVQGAKKTIELYAGNDIYATLRQERGQPAVVETAEGRWTLQRRKGKIAVRAEGSESDLATYSGRWTGEGRLEFASGYAFDWVRTSPWRAERAFVTEGGQRIVRCRRDYGLTRLTDRAEIEPGAAAMPHLALLVALGRYLGTGDDDGSAAAMATMAI